MFSFLALGLIMAGGMALLDPESRPERLWVPPNSATFKASQFVEENFERARLQQVGGGPPFGVLDGRTDALFLHLNKSCCGEHTGRVWPQTLGALNAEGSTNVLTASFLGSMCDLYAQVRLSLGASTVQM